MCYHEKNLPLNGSHYPHCEPGPWIVVKDLQHYPKCNCHLHSSICKQALTGFLFSRLFLSSKTIHNHNFSVKNHPCSESQGELAIVLPYSFDSDYPHHLRQGWRHVQNGDCDHRSWRKLEIDYNAGETCDVAIEVFSCIRIA